MLGFVKRYIDKKVLIEIKKCVSNDAEIKKYFEGSLNVMQFNLSLLRESYDERDVQISEIKNRIYRLEALYNSLNPELN